MLTRIAIALSLLATPALAKPAVKRPARVVAVEPNPSRAEFIADCIHERTGPDGGIPVDEARALCTKLAPAATAAERAEEATRAAKLAKLKAKTAAQRAKALKALAKAQRAAVKAAKRAQAADRKASSAVDYDECVERMSDDMDPSDAADECDSSTDIAEGR